MCCRITRAPKGSAAFDVTSEQEYHGVVLDRMVKSKHTVSSGLLHYEDNSTPAKLTFGPRDLLVSVQVHSALVLAEMTGEIYPCYLYSCQLYMTISIDEAQATCTFLSHPEPLIFMQFALLLQKQTNQLDI